MGYEATHRPPFVSNATDFQNGWCGLEKDRDSASHPPRHQLVWLGPSHSAQARRYGCALDFNRLRRDDAPQMPPHGCCNLERPVAAAPVRGNDAPSVPGQCRKARALKRAGSDPVAAVTRGTRPSRPGISRDSVYQRRFQTGHRHAAWAGTPRLKHAANIAEP